MLLFVYSYLLSIGFLVWFSKDKPKEVLISEAKKDALRQMGARLVEVPARPYKHPDVRAAPVVPPPFII